MKPDRIDGKRAAEWLSTNVLHNFFCLKNCEIETGPPEMKIQMRNVNARTWFFISNGPSDYCAQLFLKLGIQYERLPCHLATSLWRRVFSFLTELYTVGRTERKPKSPVVGFIVGVTKSCPWSPPNITPPPRRPMKPSQYVYTRRALFKRLHQHLITFAPFFLC